MTRTFRTHMLAGVMAFAVALSGLNAAPARAGSDTARIITGLGALAIIGGAIVNSHDHRHGVTRYGYGGYSDGYHHHRGYGYGRRHGYGYSPYGYGYNRRGYGHNRRGYGHNRHYRHNHHYRHYNRGHGHGHHR